MVYFKWREVILPGSTFSLIEKAIQKKTVLKGFGVFDKVSTSLKLETIDV